MSSNALLWTSQGTKPEERLDKYKYLKSPSQGFSGNGVEVFNDESYVISGDRGGVAYVIGGQRGQVDYEDLV